MGKKHLEQNVTKDARLHPKTVSAMSQKFPQRKRATAARKTTGGKNGAITHIRVRKDVWATALRLAGRETSRIEIVANDNVIVHNNPRKGKK